jgi:hypothetical protein
MANVQVNDLAHAARAVARTARSSSRSSLSVSGRSSPLSPNMILSPDLVLVALDEDVGVRAELVAGPSNRLGKTCFHLVKLRGWPVRHIVFPDPSP